MKMVVILNAYKLIVEITMAATNTALGGLHLYLTQTMTKGLERELEEMDNNEFHVPSPAFLGVVAKFLKDNDITCSPDELASEMGIASILQAKRQQALSTIKLEERH